jgi:hypothetical protein
MWGAVFTALAAVAAVIRYFLSPYNLLISLAIGIIPALIVGWLLGTLITWLWRKAGNRQIMRGVVIYATILLCITLLAMAEFILYQTQQIKPVPQATPTEIPTIQPTPVLLNNCVAWDTITLSEVGQTLCIYGRVSESSGTNILFSRSTSQVRIIYRAIGTYLTFRQGDCIFATGLITNENGILMLTTSEISYCPAGFNP